MQIPDYIQAIADNLIQNGFSAYLVGGSVRDSLLGLTPYDYDLSSNAKPVEIKEFFSKTINTGEKYGTISVIIQDKNNKTHKVHITTFRTEKDYADHRRPNIVDFTDSIEEDLSRRDFTINAMAQNLNGKTSKLIDPFDGQKDLEKKLVRAVRDPKERFSEDPLRMFKACRMASQLEFEIEPHTLSAIKDLHELGKTVSQERIRTEFMYILTRSKKPSVGIEYLRTTGLLKLFLPELESCYGVEQKLHHAHDVYQHSLNACDLAPTHLRLAALLHDIGKPIVDTKDGHFYNHENVGAEIAANAMKRLTFSNAEIAHTSNLIKNHMFSLSEKWTDKAVRRFVNRVGRENIGDLFALRTADVGSNPNSGINLDQIEMLHSRILELESANTLVGNNHLAISGSDLIRLGIPKGPEVGRILKILVDKIIEDPSVNTKQHLLEIAIKS